jgi:hypothetical protein
MTRFSDTNADLRRILSAPVVRSANVTLLGEGDHTNSNGQPFTVAWTSRIIGGPGWCWSDSDGEPHGPFNTAHTAYLAGYHKGDF